MTHSQGLMPRPAVCQGRRPVSIPKNLSTTLCTSRSTPGGECKHMTVLFADLQDSTALAQAVDLEVLHTVLYDVFTLMLTEVQRVDGTVHQFTGDGIMALFGASLAPADHACRALHAALGIQRAFAAYADCLRCTHRINLALRIGLHTGLVIVGMIGNGLRMDHTVQGFTVHLANRLQKLAHAGAIYLSEAVQQQTAGFFRNNDLGFFTLPGVTGPVRVYECMGTGQASCRPGSTLLAVEHFAMAQDACERAPCTVVAQTTAACAHPAQSPGDQLQHSEIKIDS
jgi:class 3 adenylate cyclase